MINTGILTQFRLLPIARVRYNPPQLLGQMLGQGRRAGLDGAGNQQAFGAFRGDVNVERSSR
jgi:hypothetical protein